MSDSSIYPFMQYSILFLFSALLAFSIFYICVEQIFVLYKSRTTQRAIYKKRALQSGQLILVLSFVSSAILSLHYKELFLALAFSIATFVFNTFWLLGVKSEKSVFTFFSGALSVIFSLSFAVFTYGCAYVQFYTNYPMTFLFEQVPANLNIYEFTPALFYTFLPYIQFTNVKIYLLISFFLYLVFSGNSIAFSLQLQNTLFSRKKDDYGRDYYSSTLTELGKNAFRSTLMLCLLISLFIFLSFTRFGYIPFTLNKLSAILLLLPIATVNFAILGMSYNPLRHKIALIISPLLVFTGSAYFLFQSIIPLASRVIEQVK